jgi:hypothetical protein
MFQRITGATIGLAVLCASSAAMADDVRVFVMAGQSNMVGYGEGAELPANLASQADVLYDHFNPGERAGGSYVGSASTDFGPLSPKGSEVLYGPEITFGATIKGQLPGETVAIVKMAASGSNIVEHWARGVPEDGEYPEKSQLYHALLGTLDSGTYGPATDNELAFPNEATRLDAALARLQGAGHNASLGCFLWVQGENESGWNAAFSYDEKLSGLIGALREDLGRPDLPVVIARTASQTGQAAGGPSPDANLAAVRAAQEGFVAADEHATLVDMDDLPGAGDNLHFTSDGYKMLGERLATACAGELDITPSTSSTSTGAGGGGESGATVGSGSGPTSGAGAGGADGAGGSDDGDTEEDRGGCSVGAASSASGSLLFVGLALFGVRRRKTAKR